MIYRVFIILFFFLCSSFLSNVEAVQGGDREVIVQQVVNSFECGATKNKCGTSFSQLKVSRDAEEMCEAFMHNLYTVGVEAAFNILRPYSKITERDYDKFADQAFALVNSVEPEFGKEIGYEFVAKDKAGKSLLKILYLQKFEKHALRWSFFFYKADDEWLFNEFNVDNQLGALFDV